jgi:hypothetical protein
VKPSLDALLMQLGTQLRDRIAPQVATSYLASGVGLTATMLALAAQQFDSAAQVRVAENSALRALFARAADVVDDAALRAQLREAASGSNGDLRISALDAANDRLLRTLITLHAAVDARDEPWASALNGEIWSLLSGFAERR